MIAIPSASEICTTNRLGLYALHLWAGDRGVECAARTFRAPVEFVNLVLSGSRFGDELASCGFAIWGLQPDFVRDVKPALQSPPRPPSALLRAVWNAQEAFLSCVARHWRSSPFLASALTEVGEREASWIASLSRSELTMRARMGEPFMCLRPDLLSEAGRTGASLVPRLLVLGALERAGLVATGSAP